jgi:hypothetical protein
LEQFGSQTEDAEFTGKSKVAGEEFPKMCKFLPMWEGNLPHLRASRTKESLKAGDHLVVTDS